jgi:hypothetical protein
MVAGACLNPRPEELPSQVDDEGTPAAESAGTGNASEGDTPTAGILTPEEADPSTEQPGLPDIGDVDAGPDAGAPTVSPADGGSPSDGGAPAVE